MIVAGPDDIYSEELKNFKVQMLSLWTEFLKKCVEVRTILKKMEIFYS
jgi:hypothetical protein